jgi:hypothetical protein
MKPAPRSDPDLLAWVAAIIQHEQARETHGEIRIQLKAGRIQSAKVESCHLPPKPKESQG